MTKSISKFVAATVAFLTGDTDTVIALRNEKLASASIRGQISALEGAIVEAEMNVETSEESLTKAIYPTEQISNAQGYYNRIIGCQEVLDNSKDDLSDLQASLKYAQDLLKDKF